MGNGTSSEIEARREKRNAWKEGHEGPGIASDSGTGLVGVEHPTQGDVTSRVPTNYDPSEEEQPTTFGNYIGPYWSNGQLQSSVKFGEKEAKSALDGLARLHDTAYAVYSDRKHREAADFIFAEKAKKLVGRFPHLAADLVKYGNYTGRQASQLGSDFKKYGPLGVIKFGATNIYNMNKMLNGTYLKNEKADIEKLYSQDPKIKKTAMMKAKTSMVGPSSKLLSGSKPPKTTGATPRVKSTQVAVAETGSIMPGPHYNQILIHNQAIRFIKHKKKHKAAQDSKLPQSKDLKFAPGTPEIAKQRIRRIYTMKRNKVLPK